ncbi:MAG: nucleotidyl transferase AbiEii/AbiGii toxin family protein [Planctomycetota bacterium]|nr:nucleotidyl transferase AbiEii/AbiGii toxin family protein [Planctomycetota bacterium]MDA1200790.1 nucleotidyl transferase AbiEii/AbiGii toxin family protein [Planctomycetota bacterium]
MFPAETFRDTLTRLVEILHRQGIRFHLTGGVTSIAYGEPRMTEDVDLVVDPRALAADVNVFLAAAETAGFLVDRDTARKAVANGGMFQMLDLAESLKVDLYAREMIPGELDRSVEAEVFAGLHLPIASRADAALSKLVWISKGSHKSRRDLRQILRRASVSDRTMVAQWAAEHRLTALLTEVLEESDTIEP